MNYARLEHIADRGDWIVVNWCLLNVCNFKCSYCPDFLHNSSEPWPDYSVVESFCSKVINHYADKKIYFEFTGGEVTLWKDFLKLCDFLKNNNARVGCISNLSRTERYWTELKDKLDHVCGSFHAQFSRKDHFLKILDLLKDSVRTHANIMMLPEQFDICLEVAKEVYAKPNISIALQPLLVDFKDRLYNYSEEQKQILAIFLVNTFFF
jgi:MoaA/NifB/PqqE/SkfB family radical SAM enzyme